MYSSSSVNTVVHNAQSIYFARFCRQLSLVVLWCIPLLLVFQVISRTALKILGPWEYDIVDVCSLIM